MEPPEKKFCFIVDLIIGAKLFKAANFSTFPSHCTLAPQLSAMQCSQNMHFCFSVLQNTNAGDTVLRSHIKKILILLEEIKTREVKSDDGSVKVYNNVYRTKGPEADPQSKEERRSSLHATSDLRIYAKGPPGLHFKRDHPSDVHIINQENLNKRYGEVKAK